MARQQRSECVLTIQLSCFRMLVSNCTRAPGSKRVYRSGAPLQPSSDGRDLLFSLPLAPSRAAGMRILGVRRFILVRGRACCTSSRMSQFLLGNDAPSLQSCVNFRIQSNWLHGNSGFGRVLLGPHPLPIQVKHAERTANTSIRIQRPAWRCNNALLQLGVNQRTSC